MNGTSELLLKGCSPVPLAHYLKALGVLRLVAEQRDTDARGFWRGDTFYLRSNLDKEGLVSFFLEEYEPTPIIAPWNGGSGFYQTDRTEALKAIVESKSKRFSRYAQEILGAKKIIKRFGLTEKPSKDVKSEILEDCRSNLSDNVIPWLDAAFVITGNGPQYPPLLGTGGNDGRLEFTNNFMQRLITVIHPSDGSPTAMSKRWILGSLFGEPVLGLQKKAAIGQFLPVAAGGANTTSGFDAVSLSNPWDYILMLEGAILFAGASVKRLDVGSQESGALSYPFSVPAMGVGYGSASIVESKLWVDQKEREKKKEKKSKKSMSRSELWVPLWTHPTSLGELRMIMSEGRVQIGRRPVTSGIDFARAIGSFGVDRGIASFQRYGFLIRNGLSYFATPLDRITVKRRVEIDLLWDIDRWLRTLHTYSVSEKTPTSVKRAINRLDECIFRMCKSTEPTIVQDVLIALGECERALSNSQKWSKKRARPVSMLSPRWLSAAYDGSPEFRLAASLASVYGRYKGDHGEIILPIRYNMEPIMMGFQDETNRWVNWRDVDEADVVWTGGDPVDAINAVMSRRIVRAVKSLCETFPDRGVQTTELTDIIEFIEGRIDFERFNALLWGLILVNWSNVAHHHSGRSHWSREGRAIPDAAYSLLKVCFPGFKLDGIYVPVTPEIHRLAANGMVSKASRAAVRRLKGCGLAPAIDVVHIDDGAKAKRIAASLQFPISRTDLMRIAELVLRPSSLNVLVIKKAESNENAEESDRLEKEGDYELRTAER